MLESRIKIWFGKDITLSTQFTMQCNFLTEGCHGGWGLLRGLFLESYYTVEESCAPYEAQTKVDGCSTFKDCKPAAKVANTYYIGSGYYGGMSEEDIIRELRSNGPVLFDFEAGREFQVYSSGILVDPNLESIKMLSSVEKEELISED